MRRAQGSSGVVTFPLRPEGYEEIVMQEACGRTFSFSHLSLFPFMSLEVKPMCQVFINGVDFQDIFGVGILKKVAG